MSEARRLTVPRGVGHVTELAWSPDEKKLAAVTDQGWLLVWYVASGQRFVECHLTHNRLSCVSWDHRSHALAVGSENGSLYRVSRLTDPLVFYHLFDEPVARVAWSTSPVGICLLVAGSTLRFLGERGAVTAVRYASPIRDVAWAGDGQTLAVVCLDGLVEIANVKQRFRQPCQDIPGPLCVSWRKDGQCLAIGTGQGAVYFSSPLAQVQKHVVCTRFPIHAVSWGPDGLLLKDSEGKLCLVQEQQEVLPLASLRPTPSFALDRPGSQLATVSGKTITLAPF